VAGASRTQPVGIGMLFYEDGTWGMTTFGVGGVEPPRTFDQMCDAADAVLPEHVAAIRQAEPIGEIADEGLREPARRPETDLRAEPRLRGAGRGILRHHEDLRRRPDGTARGRRRPRRSPHR